MSTVITVAHTRRGARSIVAGDEGQAAAVVDDDADRCSEDRDGCDPGCHPQPPWHEISG
jgi:hypothetical protein